MPTGSVPPSDAVVAVPPALSSPAEPVSLRVEPTSLRVDPVGPALPVGPMRSPVDAMSPSAGPVGPVSPSVEGVLSVLRGARDVVTRASRVPLGDTGCETLADVIAVASRLRSATDAVLLAATAALEAARAGSGRSALRERARVSKRDAKRTAEVGEQVALMPNVARGLAVGELNVEHAAVLADAARRTSPDAVDSAAELLEAAAVVSPETLRDQAKKFTARHDPAAAMTGAAGAAMTTGAATAMPDTASTRTHMPTTTPRTVGAAAPGSARAAMLRTATKAKPNPTNPATPHTATTPTLTAAPRTLEAAGMALRGPARKATSPRRTRRAARSIAGGPRKHPTRS